MSGFSPDYGRRHLLRAARGRREARRRLYWKRRLVVLLLLLLTLTALFLGARWLLGRQAPPAATPDTAALSAALPAATDSRVPVGDLDGDGKLEWIALGPSDGALRTLTLMSGPDRSAKPVGEPVKAPAYPVAIRDLPRARGILVMTATLPTAAPPEEVLVDGQKALQAHGGEPDYLAWRPDPAKGLVPVDYYQLAAPVGPPAPTAIVVDKWLNVLWYYEDGQLALTYRVTTGKHLKGPSPTAVNQARNFLTPTGKYTIVNRVPGMGYWKDQIPAGDPRNPLGTRWLGFSVYPGDKGLVWSIHGTNEPDLVGQWASTGCIRLRNADIEVLYDRVRLGTVLEIFSSGAP